MMMILSNRSSSGSLSGVTRDIDYIMDITSQVFEFEGRRLQLHTFHRMNKDFKMVAFELFYVAAAPFCGPIATLRDRNVHTE